MNPDAVPDSGTLRAAMVATLVRDGLSDPRWISAFGDVLREHFVPRFLVPAADGPREVHRENDQATWLRLAYRDEPLTISADGEYSTSSSSQPSLMAAMLQSLRCQGSEHVLEIGTGTGYNAALLCHGLSDDHVASVDIDPYLIEAAKARLAAIGYRPHLACGDGEAGYPQAAPFDRLIATCSVARVPAAGCGTRNRSAPAVSTPLWDQRPGHGRMVSRCCSRRSRRFRRPRECSSESASVQPTWRPSRDRAIAHVTGHAGTDEPTGTWIGSACADLGLTIGSDVDIGALRNMCREGQIADLIWEAPADLVSEHNTAHQAAMQAYEAGNTEVAEHEWNNVQALWSRAWAANCAAIDFMQGAGLTMLSPVKPQRWVVASFEHHCGPHGFQLPHVHNVVATVLTS